MKKPITPFKILIVGLTFLTTMLMPQLAYADYISEVCVHSNALGSNNTDAIVIQQLADAGYTNAGMDCNYETSAGTIHVHVGYKTSANVSDAITGFLIVRSTNGKIAENVTVEYEGKTYHRAPHLDIDGHYFMEGDLNGGRGSGKVLYLFYTKDGNTADCSTLVTGMTVGTSIPTGNVNVGILDGESYDPSSCTNYGSQASRVYLSINRDHYHTFTAAWTWNGLTSATATLTCADCSTTREDVSAVITDEVTTAPTCTTDGVRTYTATVSDPGRTTDTYTDQQTASEPKLGHAYDEPEWSWTGVTAAKATFHCTHDGCTDTQTVTAVITSDVTTTPTCTADGVRTYTATAANPLDATVTYTNQTTAPEPQLGHAFGTLKAWTWDGVTAATATFSCTHDGCTETYDVKAEVEDKGITTPATCTFEGIHSYVATVTNPATGATVTDTKTETVPAKGHEFTELEKWTWNGTTSAVATFGCTRCEGTHEVEAQITDDGITVEAKCETTGIHQYTATVANPLDATQSLTDVLEDVIPALGHSYDTFQRWTWSYDYIPHAYFSCSRCNDSKSFDCYTAAPTEHVYYAKCYRNGKNILHVYAENPVTGEKYYTDRVQYTDAPDHEDFLGGCEVCEMDMHDYLSFTAVNGPVKIILTNYDDNGNTALAYSFNKNDWYAFGGNITLSKDQTVYLRCVVGQPIKAGAYFTFWDIDGEPSGQIEAHGNIMSLVDPYLRSNTIPAEGMFRQMFGQGGFEKSAAKLLTAPKLPALNLTPRCYQAMFCNCVNLREAPELPAKYVRYLSYDGMFYNCTSLKELHASFDYANSVNLPKFFTASSMTKGGNLTIYFPFDVVNGNNASTLASRLSCSAVKCEDDEILLTDAEGFNVSCDITVNKVTYKRTMANQWGTLCLPFEIEVSDEAPYEFYSITSITDDELEVSKITDNIAAGTPVLVCRNASAEGITISKTNPTFCKQPTDVNADGFTMSGTFQKETFTAEDNVYFIKDNTFYRFASAAPATLTMSPFRGYFTSTAASATALGIRISDGLGTYIEPTIIDADTDVIYDLQGRRVAQPTQGIYIVNGKKVLFK